MDKPRNRIFNSWTLDDPDSAVLYDNLTGLVIMNCTKTTATEKLKENPKLKAIDCCYLVTSKNKKIPVKDDPINFDKDVKSVARSFILLVKYSPNQ
jgi:hypothetical protein